MAQRVRIEDLEGTMPAVGAHPSSAPHYNITPGVVDRAVRETFEEAGVSPEVARVMRDLMSNDSNSAVARAYYHSRASAAGLGRVTSVVKPVMEVSQVLSETQAADLVEYAFDFSLKFRSRESHDHGMAAACRMVDRALVESRLPPGAAVSHVGAAVIPLMYDGRLGNGHHGCVPVVDRKDPARHVLVRMRARKLAADRTVAAAVRASAMGYLNKVEAYVCDKPVQDCAFKTPVMTSVHVYDVPMADWAGVMDKKGARLLEGCVLFPRDLFDKHSGEMAVAGARYEVDAPNDKFRMGFVDSPSWWYEHSLSEYLRYGVDQVLCSGGHTYSYKIVERRGDTLFFRILRVATKMKPEFRQTYRVPGIEMVRVNGFPIVETRQEKVIGHARRTYLFPRALWEDMLEHAKECAERGVLTPERLFNYYRTVAPRQSVNAVVVSGGAVVEELSQLVPLVTHVALFALLEVKRVALDSQHQLAAVMHERARASEGTFAKVVAGFSAALALATGLTAAPLRWVDGLLKDGPEGIRVVGMYDWALNPTTQSVSAKLVLPCIRGADAEVVDGDEFSSWYSAAAPLDMARTAVGHAPTAKFLLDVLGEDLPQVLLDAAKETMVETVKDDKKRPVHESAHASAEAVPSVGTAETVEITAEEVERRRRSIIEAIAECNAEAAKGEAGCAEQFRTLLVGNVPSRQKLADYKESFHNPEFWYVSSGVIESSLTGVPVRGFQHAAVYSPTPFGKARLLLVSEEVYKGMSEGEYVERTHYKIANPEYTGWVYTNDSLLIYNGPAVTEALEAALDMPLDFAVVLNQGPPGCGKTTQIVARAELSDVVLVPVRKAARETAGRLGKRSPEFALMASDRVRTVDSYLVNVLRNRKLRLLRPARLLADEAFMTREGRWLAAAALLGVGVVEAYGDAKQIPHVPRAECPKSFVKLQHNRESVGYLTHRCPKQSLACWGSVYDWRVRSTSEVQGSVKRVDTSVGMDVPEGCVMMGMYQADKKLLAEKYARYGASVQIMTVHESEGNTYRDVWLHRFDTRKRTDTFSLYDKEEYALVAMSRNTHSFVYVSLDLGDQVCKFIKQGADVRRVSGAGDVVTAGSPKEFG